MTMLAPKWLGATETSSLLRALEATPRTVRFVGGCVRDALLGIEATDIDLATILLPPQILEKLSVAGVRAIPTGIDHGTITAIIDGRSFEITTLRKDTACDGRHAEVAFTDSWELDAQRRDFTMNALYMSQEGEVFDFVGGAEDARAGRVRFIGVPSDRISEDYLRILRFFRFYARYGKGDPDSAALTACAALAPQIALLSGERIAQEMIRLVAIRGCAKTVSIMQKMGVLKNTFGFEIENPEPFLKMCDELPLEIDAPLKLCAFILYASIERQHAQDSLIARLKLSKKLRKTVSLMLQYVDSFPAEDFLQKKLLRQLGPHVFGQMAAVVWAYRGVPQTHALQLARHWVIPEFPLIGADLIALGFEEGARLGAALHVLESLWEESNYSLNKHLLLSAAKTLL